MNAEQLSRFWSHVVKSDGCWLWNASTRKGYGVFCPTKRSTTTVASVMSGRTWAHLPGAGT